MNKYNVKILNYPRNGEMEVRIYKEPIKTGFIKDDKENKVIVAEKTNEEKILDCIRSFGESSRRSKDKIYQYARSNDWEWFVTLTFDPSKVDSLNYDECSKKIASWLNNIRKRKCLGMKYIGVPELHKSGRYHFHFLMSNISEMDFIDSGKRDIKGRPIYNLGNYKYGWTTATTITDSAKVSNYLSKYITKALAVCTKNKKRYWCSKNLVVPEVNQIMMSPNELEEFKLSIKGKTTSAKVVSVDTPEFKNEIEYLQVKYSTISNNSTKDSITQKLIIEK